MEDLKPSGSVAGNDQNVPTAHTPRTRSSFDLKYHLFDTHRFGEYHPHYVEQGVKDDDLPVRSSHDVLSYTLKSPLMQSVDMYKDYFLVPMEAILPLNWDKVFVNPVRGDDVPNDAGSCVPRFWFLAQTICLRLSNTLATVGSSSSYTSEQKVQALIRWIVTLEYLYSNGSLMTSLGSHGSPYIQILDNSKPVNQREISLDVLFDDVIRGLVTGPVEMVINVDGISYAVGTPNRPYDGSIISMRHALSLIRDNLTFKVVQCSPTFDIERYISDIFTRYTISFKGSNAPFDLCRLWAYQLVCAHYYTNDHIDFVYSANLYRELVSAYIMGFERTTFTNFLFTYNGIKYQYDALSGRGFVRLASCFSGASADGNSIAYLTDIDTTTTNERSFGLLGYMSALFAYRRSLRYQDYFTGSRSQPLAVGSTGVAVVNNQVDVINVTRNIQRQRFLNAVNRVRHDFEGYLKSIFGGETPAPDYHNPFALASTRDTVYGREVDNTGSAQMSDNIAITANFKSNGSKYMITVHCDRPCVVLGITHYDIARAYTKTTERHFFHADRFDMFNPFMQFIGDQPIYHQELGRIPPGQQPSSLGNFAYTLRHMEYKQRYHQAAGGFVEFLPGFAFLGSEDRGDSYVITPEFIRSVPSEFDNFYVSLTGYSNASYFHFIVDNYNDCTGSRPMAYAPTIL